MATVVFGLMTRIASGSFLDHSPPASDRDVFVGPEHKNDDQRQKMTRKDTALVSVPAHNLPAVTVVVRPCNSSGKVLTERWSGLSVRVRPRTR
jgi:hypothetical protein